MVRANFQVSLVVFLSLVLVFIVACGADSSFDESAAQNPEDIQSDAVPKDFQAGEGKHQISRSDTKESLSALRNRVQEKSEVREKQAASAARARLVFETAVARVRQKSQEAEMAREVAEAALAEVDAVERELLAAQSEIQQAESKLRDLGIDASREDFGISDISLFREVQGEVLRAPLLSNVAISVEVKMGIVTLRGLVPDDNTRIFARSIAEGVKGVRRVDNLLTLRAKEDLWRDK